MYRKSSRFAIQVLVCPRCGARGVNPRAVTEADAVRRLLASLGLAAEPPSNPVVSAA
jgi:hypothetical protein